MTKGVFDPQAGAIGVWFDPDTQLAGWFSDDMVDAGGTVVALTGQGITGAKGLLLAVTSLALSGGGVTANQGTAITTAATTTVVAAPAASTVRNLKNLNVSNNHASSSCVVSVQHSDGTTVVVLEKVTLLAGETLVFVPDGGWSRLTAAGAPYARNNQIPLPNLGISGALAETLPRMLVAEDVITPVSGTVYLFAVYLVKGTVVSSISAFSSGTAANAPTNQFFGLYDTKFALLATSANDTTTAWAANTIKTLAMVTPYTVGVSGFYYLSFMVSAGVVPSVKGILATNAALWAQPFWITAPTSAGVTTPLPNPCAVPATSTAGRLWMAVT